MYNTEKISEEFDAICSIEDTLTNEELGGKLKAVGDKIPLDISLNHQKTNDLLKKRVSKYCKEHNIDLTEYDGPLPMRHYKMPVGKSTPKKVEKLIKKLVKKYSNTDLT